MEEYIADAYKALAEFATSYGLRIIGAICVLVFGWLVAAWAQRRVQKTLHNAEHIDETLVPIGGRVVRILVIVITVVAVLNAFGVQTASIIAMLGGAAVAIGLALQGTLSNVASGIVLLVLKPFHVGDSVHAAGVVGSVLEVGLFAITMETLDGEHVIVPNSNVWGSDITNFTRSGRRRINLELGIGYSDDMDLALRLVREVVEAHPKIMKDPSPVIGISSHGDNSVGIAVKPWVKPGDYFSVPLDLMKQFKEAFDENGVSIPFPQRDLHLISDEVGFARQAAE